MKRPYSLTVVLIDGLMPAVCGGSAGFLAATAVKQWTSDRSSAIVASVLAALCLFASYWLFFMRESCLRRATRRRAALHAEEEAGR